MRERSKVQFYSESKTLFSSKIKKKERMKKRFASMVKGGVVHLKKTCFAPILRQIIFTAIFVTLIRIKVYFYKNTSRNQINRVYPI